MSDDGIFKRYRSLFGVKDFLPQFVALLLTTVALDKI